MSQISPSARRRLPVIAGVLSAALIAPPLLAQDGQLLALLRQHDAITAAEAGNAAHQRFEQIDANHDGAISEQELTAAAMAQFKAADTDRDQVLTRAELRAAALERLSAAGQAPSSAP